MKINYCIIFVLCFIFLFGQLTEAKKYDSKSSYKPSPDLDSVIIGTFNNNIVIYYLIKKKQSFIAKNNNNKWIVRPFHREIWCNGQN